MAAMGVGLRRGDLPASRESVLDWRLIAIASGIFECLIAFSLFHLFCSLVPVLLTGLDMSKWHRVNCSDNYCR